MVVSWSAAFVEPTRKVGGGAVNQGQKIRMIGGAGDEVGAGGTGLRRRRESGVGGEGSPGSKTEHADPLRGKMKISSMGVEVLQGAVDVGHRCRGGITRRAMITKRKCGDAVGIQPLRGGDDFAIGVVIRKRCAGNQ
jgi:hypothetical protein